MAKSLDKLIEYTLEEIAICGRQGATLEQVTTFVRAYYLVPSKGNHHGESSQSESTQHVDQAFLRRAFVWLARHPDISVRDGKRHTKKSVAHQYLSTWATLIEDPVQTQEKYSGNLDTETSDADIAVEPRNQKASSNQDSSVDRLRFYVNESRIYSTICGKCLESQKPSSLEFVLLSLIAAAREDGILQGDLVRTSGQDKRSVPKRTDALQRKEHVVKQEVFVKGSRTSKLILRRFVQLQSKGVEDNIILNSPSHTESAENLGMHPLLDTEINPPDMKENHIPGTSAERRNIPQWSPDRSLANTLQEVANLLGIAGMTNIAARTMITGPFVRRTLEALLLRLSYRSLQTQPDHLQHHTLVRSSANVDGVVHYFHHTLKSFLELAESGKVTLSSVTGGDRLVGRLSAGLVQEPILSLSAKSLKEVEERIVSDLASPLHQFKNGQASFEDLLDSVYVDDLSPRDGEPNLAIGAGGDYVLEFSHELSINRSQRAVAATTQSSLGKRKPTNAGKGRPRKFLKGTEKFWQNQFSSTKTQANQDSPAGNRHSGQLADTINQNLFSQRPQDFDETLVDAIESGLPVPASPDDISEAWINATREILDRSGNGIYITPVGIHMGRTRRKSQIMILRSKTLQQPKLQDRAVIAKVRYISSSYSHTLPYNEFYLQSNNKTKHWPNSNSSVNFSLTETEEQARSNEMVTSSEISTAQKTPSRKSSMRRPLSQNLDTIKDRTRKSTAESNVQVAQPPSAQTLTVSPTQDLVEGDDESISASTERGATNDPAQDVNQLFSEHSNTDLGLNAIGPAFTVSSTRKRKFPSLQSSNGKIKQQPKKPLEKDSLSKRDFAVSCRKVILHLIEQCSGIAPNDASTLRRIMTDQWQVLGRDDRPPLKVIKNAIKSLCDNGKLKQVMFSFRRKEGQMLTKSILVIPTLGNNISMIDDLRQKIIEADPTEYLPPEWNNSDLKFDSLILTENDGSLQNTQPPSKRSTLGNEDLDATRDDEQRTSGIRPFLTLAVPNLGRLKQVQNFNNEVQQISNSAQSPSMLGSADAGAPRVSSVRRRVGLRRGKAASFDPKTHKIVWKASEEAAYPPESLSVILRMTPADKFGSAEVDLMNLYERFVNEVDKVSAWEQESFDNFQKDRTKWVFINHVSKIDSLVQSPVRLERLWQLNKSGDIIEGPYPSEESWPPFRNALDLALSRNEHVIAQSIESTSPSKITDKSRSVKSSRRTRRIRDQDELDPDFGTENQNVKTKRRKTLQSKDRTSRLPSVSSIANPSTIESPGFDPKSPINRRQRLQFLRHLPDEAIHRIIIAVICVRTLAGGLEKYIDWKMVTKLFPGQEEDFIRERWRTISNKYRRDIQFLTDNLQHKYLISYERNEVPSVNFEDLQATDWNGIYSWALRTLKMTDEKQSTELPSTREQLLDTYDFSFNEYKGVRHLQGYNLNITVPQKEQAMNETVFATPVDSNRLEKGVIGPIKHEYKVESEMLDPEFLRARSWVLTSILTPDDQFKARQTHIKFLHLADTPERSEELISRTINSLQREKLIVRRVNKKPTKNSATSTSTEELGSLRTWEISSKFFENFEWRRMITATMLKTAYKYKIEVLDIAFSTKSNTISIEKDALLEDGEMLAILNLLSMNMIKIKPGLDLPHSRYGLDWKKVKYETRFVDKSSLSFSIEIESTSSYIFGDPFDLSKNSTSIPRSDDNNDDDKIPAWFDVNQTLQPKLWEIFVGAIIGILSIRPGIDKKELSRTINWSLTIWEIELILTWLERTKCIKRTKSGWETMEWWWICLGGS